MKEYTMDAKDKSLGRIASEAAAFLRGKNSVEFRSNRIPDMKLIILHADQIKLTGQKEKQKKYKSYSGYPGSLKFRTAGKIIENKGKSFILKKAVFGMLPKNKLRVGMIKNLIIK